MEAIKNYSFRFLIVFLVSVVFSITIRADWIDDCAAGQIKQRKIPVRMNKEGKIGWIIFED